MFGHYYFYIRVLKQSLVAAKTLQKKNSMKYARKERGHYTGKSPKQGLASAENQNVNAPEGLDSLYHRLDEIN